MHFETSFDLDPELIAIETTRNSPLMFRTPEPDPKTAVFLQINKLSLSIRMSKVQNNELLLNRTKLYLDNSHLDNTFPEGAYEDLKAIIDDIHTNSKPDHEQIKARVYKLIENRYELYQRLSSYEQELNPHQELKRARTRSPF